MQRSEEDRLTRLALEAIEEAAAACHLGPVQRSRGIALALAWLLHRAGEGAQRWPFDSYWQGLTCEWEHDRWSAVNAATNAIYLATGIRRELAVTSRFEAKAKGVASQRGSEAESRQ